MAEYAHFLIKYISGIKNAAGDERISPFFIKRKLAHAREGKAVANRPPDLSQIYLSWCCKPQPGGGRHPP